MHVITTVLASLALVIPALAAPALQVEKYDGETNGRYIVTLKQGVAQHSFLKASKVNATQQWTIINGFTSALSAHEFKALAADPSVESISEDGIMHTMNAVTQDNAPWGLARLSSIDTLNNQNPYDLDFDFTYDSSAGEGVDIYVVDTGINTAHVDFGGRASWGATFGGYANADGNGHGTHCAGIAAGSRFGVAKKANLIAVKVLGDDGSGSIVDIISGLNYVYSEAAVSGRPTVASLCLGGSTSSTPLDNAVATLTGAGIHVVVSAGNDNIDAYNVSPARAPTAITVGASTIADARAWFSNYGSVVNIFAPGAYITSTWIGSTTAVNTLSGTSMAACYIAGLVASLISSGGILSPAAMGTKLKNLSLNNVLTGIPSGTVNYLAQNGLAPE